MKGALGAALGPIPNCSRLQTGTREPARREARPGARARSRAADSDSQAERGRARGVMLRAHRLLAPSPPEPPPQNAEGSGPAPHGDRRISAWKDSLPRAARSAWEQSAPLPHTAVTHCARGPGLWKAARAAQFPLTPTEGSARRHVPIAKAAPPAPGREAINCGGGASRARARALHGARTRGGEGETPR